MGGVQRSRSTPRRSRRGAVERCVVHSGQHVFADLRFPDDVSLPVPTLKQPRPLTRVLREPGKPFPFERSTPRSEAPSAIQVLMLIRANRTIDSQLDVPCHDQCSTLRRNRPRPPRPRRASATSPTRNGVAHRTQADRDRWSDRDSAAGQEGGDGPMSAVDSTHPPPCDPLRIRRPVPAPSRVRLVLPRKGRVDGVVPVHVDVGVRRGRGQLHLAALEQGFSQVAGGELFHSGVCANWEKRAPP